MAGCVFGYFADCTVVMPLFLLIAILRNVGVGMLRFGWRAWASYSQAASPWLRSPHFIMFSGYQLTKVCQKIRSHFINKQRHPFWPFSKHFTIHPPPTDLFISTPTRLLWEAFSHATITARLRIPFAAILKSGHFRSRHDAPVHSAE